MSPRPLRRVILAAAIGIRPAAPILVAPVGICPAAPILDAADAMTLKIFGRFLPKCWLSRGYFVKIRGFAANVIGREILDVPLTALWGMSSASAATTLSIFGRILPKYWLSRGYFVKIRGLFADMAIFHGVSC